MRSLATTLAACLLVAGVTACGGGGDRTSAVPSQPGGVVQSSVGRKAQSSCVPDSYGYCLASLGATGTNKICYPAWHYETMVYRYELYHNGTAAGEYDKTVIDGSCDGSDPEVTWSPQDPASATDDPNLP